METTVYHPKYPSPSFPHALPPLITCGVVAFLYDEGKLPQPFSLALANFITFTGFSAIRLDTGNDDKSSSVPIGAPLVDARA